MNKKPNIVIFFTDDQRFDTIRALGNDAIYTPNMDKLVERGTSFECAHIPGGTTGAVCMPSRAMLLTGRSLFHIKNDGIKIPEQHVMLGEVLKENGYKTFGTGKWHNGTDSYARNFEDGGSIFFGGMWDHWNVPVSDYDPTGKYENTINFTTNFYYNNVYEKVHCDRFSTGKHSTDLISETVIDFITNYESEDPFFAYVSYLAPHDPRTMPEKYRLMYDPDDIILPPNFSPELTVDFFTVEHRDEKLGSYPWKEEDIKRHIAEYYGMITHLDNEIGTVIDTLEAEGKLDDTIIVLAGDNGLAIGQHGHMGKENNYEHSVRVPLIFAGPGIPEGLRLKNYVYLFDIFPSLCELVDLPIPETVEGFSVVPLFNNPEEKIRETMYFAFCESVRSVKNERYKLIEYAGKVNDTELFDLITDPYETSNLFGKDGYKEIVDNMRKELFKLRDEWDDRSHPMGKTFWKAKKDRLGKSFV